VSHRRAVRARRSVAPSSRPGRPSRMGPMSSTADVRVVPMTPAHWADVERIYAEGIATGHATFASDVRTWEAFDASKLPGHRWVAVDGDGVVLGWVAVSRVSERCVY